MTGDLMEEVEGAYGAQGDCLLQGPVVSEDAGVPVAASVQVEGSSSIQEAPNAVICTAVLPLPETLKLGFSDVADLAQVTVEPDPSGTSTEDRGGAIPRLSDVTASFCSGSSPPTGAPTVCATLGLGFPGSPVPVSVEGSSPVLGAPEPVRFHDLHSMVVSCGDVSSGGTPPWTPWFRKP